MMKKLILQIWCYIKQKHLPIKFGVAVLALGLAFRLFFTAPQIETKVSAFVDLPPPLVSFNAPPPSISVAVPLSIFVPAPAPAPVEVLTENEDRISQEKCDLFTGDWIPNPAGPIYSNKTCFLMDGHQNCIQNGRPDSDFLYWRWNPRNCELPPFDPHKFLETMRDKTWAVVGDSISRNHAESLLCMLSTAERAVEVYHDEEYRSKRWTFPSYNFTISNIWSPFLVDAAIFEDSNGVSSAEAQLQLDKLDKNWTDLYPSLDYMIISTGKWFLKVGIYNENGTTVGCHACSDRHNLTQLGFVYGYNKTLHNVLNFIAKSKHKAKVFFRTTTPDHFEEGKWYNGGRCDRTKPMKEGEIEIKDIHKILRGIELGEFERAAEEAAKNHVNLRLLDFTNLLLLRPDGHPGAYRESYPYAKDKNATVQYDCLHWCLPGPVDTWNEVIMEMVTNG